MKVYRKKKLGNDTDVYILEPDDIEYPCKCEVTTNTSKYDSYTRLHELRFGDDIETIECIDPRENLAPLLNELMTTTSEISNQTTDIFVLLPSDSSKSLLDHVDKRIQTKRSVEKGAPSYQRQDKAVACHRTVTLGISQLSLLTELKLCDLLMNAKQDHPCETPKPSLEVNEGNSEAIKAPESGQSTQNIDSCESTQNQDTCEATDTEHTTDYSDTNISEVDDMSTLGGQKKKKDVVIYNVACYSQVQTDSVSVCHKFTQDYRSIPNQDKETIYPELKSFSIETVPISMTSKEVQLIEKVDKCNMARPPYALRH